MRSIDIVVTSVFPKNGDTERFYLVPLAAGFVSLPPASDPASASEPASAFESASVSESVSAADDDVEDDDVEGD